MREAAIFLGLMFIGMCVFGASVHAEPRDSEIEKTITPSDNSIDAPLVEDDRVSDSELIDMLNEKYDLRAAKSPSLFYRPLHPSGLRLDWCRTWGGNCGEPAADEFCKRKGYSTSETHAIEPRVGLTRVLQDDRMVCWGQPCDSFKYIICK